MNQEPNYKPARRKTWAYFVTLFSVCIAAGLGADFNWPLSVLIIALFLIYVCGVSAEKIFLDLFKKKFGNRKSEEEV